MHNSESNPHHAQWQAGHAEEIAFWDGWLAARGGQWPASFSDRLNSQRPLQNSLAALLPSGSSHAHILDVGAGPLTYAGFRLSSRTIEVVAVDPLAPAYDELIARHGVSPPVPRSPAMPSI